MINATTGQVTTYAGTGVPSSIDGIASSATFNSPVGVCVDSSGTVYIADNTDCRIRRITTAGIVSTFAGSGTGFADGFGSNAMFNNPYGITIDSTGNLYIADFVNNRIRKISPGGNVTTIAGTGVTDTTDRIGSSATFYGPSGITLDQSGNVYVTDYYGQAVRKITLLSNSSPSSTSSTRSSKVLNVI
jgi:streptogramin lyase